MTTKQNTSLSTIPVTKQPTTVAPLLQQGADNSDELNLPVIIGGGISGLVLILLILLLVICLFVRRRRAQSEEKTQGWLYNTVMLYCLLLTWQTTIGYFFRPESVRPSLFSNCFSTYV